MGENSIRQGKMNNSNNFFSRRDSVAIAGSNFQLELVEKLSELREIWDEVGMSEDQRRERMTTALDHLKNLLDDMVEEENCMRETLHNTVVVSKREIDTLLQQLRRPKPAFLRDGEPTLTLLELNEKCTAFKDELQKERDLRLRERDHLLAEYAHFSVRMDAPDYRIDKSVVPDAATLESLRDDVERIKNEWDRNQAIFQSARAKIAKLSLKVSLDQPLTPFQRQLVAGEHISQDSMILSPRNMEDMSILEHMLEDKYNKFLAEIRERIGVVQFELTKWWDQCHVPLAERERFKTVDPETDPEIAIEQYNEAISYWRAFYESRKTILDKIGEWERLFQEHVEFEEREQDPNRYKNRGGALLQEEKRRKKVLALLPQVYKQLSDMVAEYDLAHPDTPFLMDGNGVMAYIDSIEAEYQEKKKREKEEKELMKKQQLMVERMYGSVQTPGSQRKRVGMAATVTPNKQVSPSKKVLGSSKPYIHSSLLPFARSPIANKTAAPSSGPGSSTKKPPLPVHGQPVKRRVLMDQQDDVDYHATAIAGPSSEERISVASSTASYGEFAKVLRARGVETQSSFIGGATQSPSKLPRKE